MYPGYTSPRSYHKEIPGGGGVNKVHLESTTVCVFRVHVYKIILLGETRGQQNVSRFYNNLCIQITHLQCTTIRRDQGKIK